MEEEKSEIKVEDDHVIFIDRLTDFPSAREKESQKEENSDKK